MSLLLGSEPCHSREPKDFRPSWYMTNRPLENPFLLHLDSKIQA